MLLQQPSSVTPSPWGVQGQVHFSLGCCSFWAFRFLFEIGSLTGLCLTHAARQGSQQVPGLLCLPSPGITSILLEPSIRDVNHPWTFWSKHVLSQGRHIKIPCDTFSTSWGGRWAQGCEDTVFIQSASEGMVHATGFITFESGRWGMEKTTRVESP